MAGAKADANTEAGDAAAAGGGGGGSGSFSEQRLAEKLNKLNNSAASIQIALSQWCIFHRKRARRVVDTWEKQFNSAINDKKISYLYLSNDILQNSKRKGGEYVNEFWRVLPRSLKYVYENGEDEGKKVVARLIGIWDERKVFGSRIESLKDDILGGSLPTLDSNEKNSNPSSNPSSNSKSARKDSSTTVKKLIVGGMPEKIVTAYQSVLDKHFDEDTALNKCKSTVVVLENINKDAEDACKYGIQQGSSLISNLQEQETILKQCIEQLEGVDSVRATLINQLREALSEQESKLELLRSQLQVARGQAECVLQLRRRLNVAPIINGMGSSSSPIMNAPPSEQTSIMMQSSGVRPMSPQLPLHPATSVPGTVGVVGDEPKKTAAAMADKLASLAAPEELLSSIFNSLKAQHAASINSGSPSEENSAGPPGFQLEKRPRIERPTNASDSVGTPSSFGQVTQVQQQIGGVPTSVGGMLQPTPANQAPGSFPPTPPPLPSLLPPLMQQFGQNTGGIMGPFGMMASSMPPPPPLPNILSAGYATPSGPPPPPPLPPAPGQPQQQSPQAPQQSPTSAGFFHSSGIGFFPPVQVQQSPSVQRQ
ncbi:hypothetical protein PR202_gb00663 [Eleusine coracana subsp. coracana]|uniref:CID domain-containing protein n=1 Tax=Eleusine coracana subsp. coracana TaxID=191504 RepID=A0AAV5DTX9_ELECO|nr:hypothetical protein PR202_gb00663 [Eleusine coracana subsp. coracana]